MWDYVRENEVPYHELFDQGYQSIGCAPCTRAVLPGENERAGRWWWESNTDKECGIHCSVELLGTEVRFRTSWRRRLLAMSSMPSPTPSCWSCAAVARW